MGAIAITRGYVAEMATGEGKTLTASIAASIWAWSGKPVHIITINDGGRNGVVLQIVGQRGFAQFKGVEQ